ncbi:DNA polymerase, partial [Lactobacillus crispatus]|nr:DNA polymerase [Lactobacillus crispatus]
LIRGRKGRFFSPLFYAKKEPNHNDSVLQRLDSICQCLNLMTLLSTFNVFVNMKLGKLMYVKVGQSYGNFGSHDFLRVPDSATNAKDLPTTNTKKK